MIYKTLKKVSDYCQLLDKSKYPNSTVHAGITWTNNGDGSWTANGTSNGISFITNFFSSNINLGGRKVAILINNDAIDNVRIELRLEDISGSRKFFYYTNNIITFPVIVNFKQYRITPIVPKAGVILNNYVFKLQLFDLTEMYGVGNEPTTVEEFKADFPNEMYDYKPYCFVPSYKNCLIHPIPITSGNLIDFPYASAYDTRQGMTFSQVDTYKVHASGVNNNYNGGVAFDFIKGKTLSAGTYTIKYYTEGTVTTDLYFRGRKNSYYGPTLFPDNTRQKTFTLTEDTAVYIAFGFVGGVDPRFTGETIDLTVWCRLERGTDVTDYISSYKKSLICTTKNLFDKSLVTENGNDFAQMTRLETTKSGWIMQGGKGTGTGWGGPGTAAWANGWFKPGCNAYNKNNQGVMLKGGDVVTVSAYYTILEDNIAGAAYDDIYVALGGTKTYNGYVHDFHPDVGVKTRISRTITIDDGQDGAYYPIFSLNSCKVLIEDIQIEYGTTPTEYHPYGYL